jgi:hypothetical protein
MIVGNISSTFAPQHLQSFRRSREDVIARPQHTYLPAYLCSQLGVAAGDHEDSVILARGSHGIIPFREVVRGQKKNKKRGG